MILLSFSFPFHFTSPPLIHPLHSTYLSLLHPSPYHLPTLNCKHTKTTHVTVLLCYCVTALLRSRISRPFVFVLTYIRFGQHVYTTWTTRIYIII